jgi:hypothetical protein
MMLDGGCFLGDLDHGLHSNTNSYVFLNLNHVDCEVHLKYVLKGGQCSICGLLFIFPYNLYIFKIYLILANYGHSVSRLQVK